MMFPKNALPLTRPGSTARAFIDATREAARAPHAIEPASTLPGDETAADGAPTHSGPARSPAEASRRILTEADAIDIWIARWLRVRRKDILARYDCDPRRLYEIWEETRFAGSRAKARAIFEDRYPSFVDRVDWGPHRRIPRAAHPDQLGLFEA